MIFNSAELSTELFLTWLNSLLDDFTTMIMIWYWAKTAELIGGPGAYKYKYNIV